MKFGNIDFNGDVLVTGAVRSGMHIKAGGNVTINGVVEGAFIEAGGDILLKSGVLGNNECEITTKGNVIGKFFENAKVVASGTVNCNYLMNSDVTGHMGVIVSGKRSTIIGGVTRAQAYVKATNIGNASEVSTVVRVGADDETVTKIRELRKQIHALTEQIEVFEKNLHVEHDQHEKIEQEGIAVVEPVGFLEPVPEDICRVDGKAEQQKQADQGIAGFLPDRELG